MCLLAVGVVKSTRTDDCNCLINFPNKGYETEKKYTHGCARVREILNAGHLEKVTTATNEQANVFKINIY